jgi:tetratricopeptide (TPR) repeat protein
LAHALRAETNGNPFFVREVLLHLVELGAITRRDGEWVAAVNLADVGLPQSVREVVGSRVRRLGEHAHRILGAAAVIGRDFDLGVLANAVGLDDDTVLDALDAAANAGLVADVPGIADRFTFTHALVQHTLYRDLSGSRRARWHARVAQALEALDKDGDGHRAAEFATHWFAASRPADVDRAIEYAIRAGDHAAAQFAAADAARWYRAALDANGPVRDERTCSLLVRLGDAQRQAGEPIFRDTLVDAAALARELERGDLLVGAALAFAKENILSLGPVDHERDAVLEEALDVLGDADTSERARLLARLATDLHYSGGTRHIDLARDAVAVARRTGDRAALAEVLGKAWNALLGPDHAEERRRYAEESDALTSDDADLFRRVVVVSNLTRSLLEFGEIEEIRPLHAQYEAVARQLGLPRLRWMAGYRGAMLATLFGELDRAEELAERALALGLEIGVPDAFVAYGGALFWLRHVRGRDHEMIPIVREALEQYADVSSISAALPFLLVHVGETAEARERFAPAVAGLDDVGKGHEWLVTMLLMAETAVLLDDRRAAARLHAAVLPLSHLVCVHSTLCLGAVSHYVGCLAAQLDRPDEAEHYLDHALSMNTRIRAPFFRAQTMVELARVVRKRDAGRALLDEARTLADTYDFVRIRAAVSA